MIPPPVPEEETARLQALRRYKILDTLPETVYDDLTNLAAHICDVPVAMISLVDATRQWFKSRHGLDATETPREVSFCGHAVAAAKLLQVPDATLDPRFSKNPFVLSGPKVRFYTGAPLITPDGHAIGTLCVIDHVSRKLRDDQVAMLEALARQVVTQFELRLAKEAAEQASRSKSAFLANVSHELRTPLNSVIGFTKVLLKKRVPSLSAEDRSFLERIDANGRHLLALINDILDLSKIEAGRVDLRIEPVDLAKVVRQAVAQMEGQAEANGVSIRLEIPDRLRAIDGDERRLKQVLLNLLGNAIKFGSQGPVALRIAADEAQRPVRLELSDAGMGIPDDKLDLVFESFQQADASTARRFGGTGLGLPISKKLCEQMGFRLDVASRVDEGSTFAIDFAQELPPLVHRAPRPAQG